MGIYNSESWGLEVLSISHNTLVQKRLFSIVLICGLIINGFTTLVIFTSETVQASSGQDLIINNTYVVSGVEIWNNITVNGTGQLVVPSGTTLYAWNIFLRNGSVMEINGGTLNLNTSRHSGDAIINGSCDYFNITNGATINIKGSDGWADTVNDFGPFTEYIPISMGGDAIIDLVINKSMLIDNSIINLDGGDGFDLPPSNNTHCNAWTNGTTLTGYAAAGGDASFNIQCNSNNGIRINNSQIYSTGGSGGDAADGADIPTGGNLNTGYGGGYTGGTGGDYDIPGSRGGNVYGYVGSGGRTNFELNSPKFQMISSLVKCTSGNGGAAGDGGDSNGTVAFPRYNGGGGGGYGGGGGGGCYKNAGDSGTVNQYVGSGGKANILLYCSESEFIKSDFNISGGAGGKAGNGGTVVSYGGGGGGGYSGGGGGGYSGQGGNGTVKDYVGSGGDVYFEISSNQTVNLSSTAINCYGGAGGLAGDGGPSEWDTSTGAGHGGGGGGGYGGGGAHGGTGSTERPGKGKVTGSVGSGGDVNILIKTKKLISINLKVNSTAGAGGDAGVGGNGGGNAGGGGGGYGGGGGAGTGLNGGNTTVNGAIGTGGDTFINVSSTHYGSLDKNSYRIIGGDGGDGKRGGTPCKGPWPDEGGGGGGGYGGGGGAKTWYTGGTCTLSGTAGDGGDATLKFYGRLAISPDNNFLTVGGAGGNGQTRSGGPYGGQGLGRSTANGIGIIECPMCLPFLLAPNNGSVIVNITPTLQYFAYPSTLNGNVKTYSILVDDNVDFSSPVVSVDTSLSNYTLPILFSGTFYWRVMAKYTIPNNANIGWSETKNFIIPGIPFITNIQKSANFIERDKIITFDIDVYHVSDTESDLVCEAASKPTSGTWETLTNISYQGTSPTGSWRVSYQPAIDAILGNYSFRSRFKDLTNNWSPWEYESFVIGNNVPTLGDIKYSSPSVNRTESLKICINASDIETAEELLDCYAQYRPPLSMDWISLPTMYYNLDHWEVMFTPAKTAKLGKYDLRVNFSDLDGNHSGWLEDLDSFRVLNNNPVIITEDQTTVFEDDVYELIYAASDVESDDLIWDYDSNADWLIWDMDKKTLAGTPRNEDIGEYWVSITVTDDDDGFSERYFTITVFNTNDPPIIDTEDKITIKEDEYYEVKYSATDCDFGDSLIWEMETNAGWLQWDDENIKLFGTPRNEDVGIHWVKINVSDGNLGFDEHAFTLTVINTNDAPTINNSPADLSFYEDTIYYGLNINDWFKDIDGDSLTYRYEGNQNILVSILENGSIQLVPTLNWNGKETLTFCGKDGLSKEVSDTITATILPVNDPPGDVEILMPGNNKEIYKGETLDFESACDDPDIIYGDVLIFNWSSNITGVLGEGETLNDILLDVGEHLITLKVMDKDGEASIAFIHVSVLDVDVSKIDSDGDGIPDAWEEKHGLNPSDPSDGNKDPDNDGVTNIKEYQKGTDPKDADTDNDGHNDGEDDYPLDPTRWRQERGESKQDDNTWVIITSILVIIVIVFVILFLFILKPRMSRNGMREESTAKSPIRDLHSEEFRDIKRPPYPTYPFQPQDQPRPYVPMYPIQKSRIQDRREKEKLVKSESKAELRLEPKEIKELLKLGSIAYSKGRYTDAILIWQQILEEEPDKHPDLKMAIKETIAKMK